MEMLISPGVFISPSSFGDDCNIKPLMEHPNLSFVYLTDTEASSIPVQKPETFLAS
jgi:hypothetical protein